MLNNPNKDIKIKLMNLLADYLKPLIEYCDGVAYTDTVLN